MTPIWSAPRSWSVGELVTAAMLNAHLRDNLDFLKTPPFVQQVSIGVGNYTVTSTTFTLIHADFEKTIITAGGRVLAYFSAYINHSTSALAGFTFEVDGVVQGGADGIGAFVGGSNAGQITFALPLLLAPGSHLIRVMTKAASGTTTVYASLSTANQRTTPIFWVGEVI